MGEAKAVMCGRVQRAALPAAPHPACHDLGLSHPGLCSLRPHPHPSASARPWAGAAEGAGCLRWLPGGPHPAG